MGANSFIFFGLLLIPLLIFLVWVIKQDKKRNYLGLFFLIVGIVIATYTIIVLDKKYLNPEGLTPKQGVIPKSSSFK
ncbi:MAG: hypothetical protein K2P75_04535 [Sphingobacteriaceae bacterium]|jgi:hypothetical protein|nr:hypothetical protein [Sphingobacteriaceae bacterium]